MPTYYARKAGNVNAVDVWATTPTGTASAVTLTASDVLVSNSFTVTLNVNTTVAEVRNDNFSGATAGGSFTLSNGVTLTANVINGSATATVGLSGSNSATVVGNVTSSIAGGAISHSGSGNLTVVGNVTGGSAQSAHGIASSTAGLCNITGTCTAGVGVSSSGVYWTGAGTCNITGSCIGGSNSNTSANGAQTASSIGTLNIYGTAVSGAVGHGASNFSTGTLFVQRAKGNGFGNGSVGLSSVPGVFANAANSTTRVAELEFGDLGQTPVQGAIILSDSTSNVVLLYRPSLTKKTLTDPAATVAFPSASDVRLGVAYNSGSQVGTLAVPMASQVAVGVAVGNTTGTAALTPAAVWDAATSGIAASGSIGERLKNAATVASTGQQLADALAGL